MRKVFVCSSPKDDAWCDALRKHLESLRLEVWSLCSTPPGVDQRRAIDQAIGDADVAVILFSVDLFADEAPSGSVLHTLLQRARQSGLPLIPVRLRSCSFDHVEDVRHLSALPRDGAPLIQEGRMREEALQEVARQIATSAPRPRSVPAPGTPERRGGVTPWIEHLGTLRGKVTLGLGILSLLAVALGVRAWRDSPWPLLGGGAVLLGALVSYLRDGLRRKRLSFHFSGSVFVGARTLTEADRSRNRFFGREREIDDMMSRLQDPQLRYLVLFGESGCGKSSLLRAGVLPDLTRQGRFVGVYLRFFDQPVRELREALQCVCPDKQEGSEQSLTEELRAARRRAGRPLVLFIDQFEEFHVNPVPEPDYQAVLEMVWAVIGRDASIDAKLVFCLRYDFLHQLDVFEDQRHIDNIFDRKATRLRLQLFDEQTAERVIKASLDEEQGTSWSPELVRRVLRDLVVRKQVNGRLRNIVHPTEMQIVCQMVQAQGVSEAGTYPGKRQLVRDYVDNAIETAPASRALTRQVLLNLIADNEVTKARPQTLGQLAAKLGVRDTRKLRLLLDYLDKERHIVNTTLLPEQGNDTGYELAHDYLASVVRGVAGTELSGTRRSQAVLSSSRLQREMNPHFRLGIGDCIRLYRYPPEEMKPEDQELIWSSVMSFALRVCLPGTLMLLLGLWVRFGTVHFVLKGSQVVIKRGSPFLKPIMGSDSVWIATDFTLSRDDYQGIAQVRGELALLESGMIWLPAGSAEKASRRWAARLSTEYLLSLRSSYKVDTWGEQGPVKVLLATGAPIGEELVATYRARLREGFREGSMVCERPEQNRSCTRANWALSNIAQAFQFLAPNDRETQRFFGIQLRNARPGSWAFDAAADILKVSHTPDHELIQALVRQLSETQDLGVIRPLIFAIASMAGTKSWATKEMSPAMRQSIGAVLFEHLSRAQPWSEDQDKSLSALISLGLPNSSLIEFIETKLSSSESDMLQVIDLLDACLGLGILNEPFYLASLRVFDQATTKLAFLQEWDNRTQSDDEDRFEKYNKNVVFINRARGFLWRLTGGVENRRDEIKYDRFSASVRKLLRLTIQKSVDPANSSSTEGLLLFSAMSGIQLNELIAMLPRPNEMRPRAYRRALLAFFHGSTDSPNTNDLSQRLPIYLAESSDWERCNWAAIGINHAITSPLIEEAVLDPECRNEKLAEAIAKHRLLRAGEKFTDSVDRLIKKFFTEESLRYPAIRHGVATALKLLAKNHIKAAPRDAQPVQQLRERLLSVQHQPETPLHLRFVLVTLIQEIDKLLWSRSLE